MMVSGYWRNGPVLNNAISGIDMALWDIKGKVADLPCYELWGGKCRPGAAVYTHANGTTPEEVVESAREKMQQGFKYVRCQLGGYPGVEGASLQRPPDAPSLQDALGTNHGRDARFGELVPLVLRRRA